MDGMKTCPLLTLTLTAKFSLSSAAAEATATSFLWERSMRAKEQPERRIEAAKHSKILIHVPSGSPWINSAAVTVSVGGQEREWVSAAS
jgi:hypothetical protein